MRDYTVELFEIAIREAENLSEILNHYDMLDKRNYNLQPVRTKPKIGRNEPFPCGSGKKFKKCCL